MRCHSPGAVKPLATTPLSRTCGRVHEHCLSSQNSAAGGAGQSPLLLLSHQISTFAGALVQSSLNYVQTSPSLGTNSSITAANKQKFSPPVLKKSNPFHRIYHSCKDPFDHRECRLCYPQGMVLVSASHALNTHSPRFYLERLLAKLTTFIISSQDTITIRTARDYHKS